MMLVSVLALSGADMALMVGALLGAGGIGGVTTGWVSLRKLRTEEAAAADSNRVAAKTVAAAEAEAAMRVMGLSVARLQSEVLEWQKRVVTCEEHCRQTRATFDAHRKICPMLGGTPDHGTVRDDT